tara:strand:+ start:3901 stop:4680 length:780 start_codon:yes stop_codon:yes gene_type:complete
MKAVTKKSSLINFDNVGLRINDRWLVRGVDMTISSGEIVTLIGPNGSGKTTTAKLTLGIHKPSEGNISRSTDTKIGYLPQKINMDPSIPMTVIRFMCLVNNLSQEQIEYALEMTKVNHLKNKQISNLSGGELQRVMLARVYASKPNLIVLDEPIQGVDINGEIAIYEIIKNMSKELNAGILLISHDLHMVMASSDRVLCLNGYVCCSGTPKVVVSSTEYIELFGTRASKELAFYTHSHNSVSDESYHADSQHNKAGESP